MFLSLRGFQHRRCRRLSVSALLGSWFFVGCGGGDATTEDAAVGDQAVESSVADQAVDVSVADQSVGDGGAVSDVGIGQVTFQAVSASALAAVSGRTVEIRAEVETSIAAAALPLSFYLVLDSSFALTGEGEEIPEQYDLGSITLEEVAEGRQTHTLTLTIPVEVVTGQYTIVGYADPDRVYFAGGEEEDRIARSESAITIANEGQVADLMATDMELDNESLEVEDDGSVRLSGVVVTRAELADVTDAEIGLCVEIGAECRAIPIWDGLTNGSVLKLEDPIEKDTETRIGFEATMTPGLAQDLLAFLVQELLKDPLAAFKNARIQVTVSSPSEPGDSLQNNTITVDIPYYRQFAAFRDGISTLDYHKAFKRSRYGKYFGGGVSLEGQAQFNADGLFANVGGTIQLKILKETETVLDTHAAVMVQPGSFEGTGYDLGVEVFGVAVYSEQSSLAQQIPDPSSTETERKKRYFNNKVTMKKYNGTSQSLVSYAKDWSIGKKKGFTKTIWVSIVPVVVTAGAQATVGLNAKIALEGITRLSATLTPNVKVGAYASGGVGNSLYSAGLESSFYFLDESFEAKTAGSLTLEEDAAGETVVSLNGNLEETITNDFRGPYGKLYLYGRYSVVRWCKKYGVAYPCGFRQKTERKYLAQWESTRKATTLLEQKQTAFVIPL